MAKTLMKLAMWFPPPKYLILLYYLHKYRGKFDENLAKSFHYCQSAVECQFHLVFQ